MSPFLTLTIGFCAALPASVLLCRLVMAAGVMDSPDGQRKAQSAPVPSSGGLGFVAAAGLGWLAALMWAGTEPFDIAVWIAGVVSGDDAMSVLAITVVAALLVGLADDLLNFDARLKLGLQVGVVVLAVLGGVRVEEIAPGFGKVRDFGLIGGALCSVLWMVTIKNAVNFMDGADGLAMGMALLASLGFCAVAGFAGEWELALAAGVLTASLLGFLVWNVPGKLYAGDAGALAVGMALGGFSILLVRARPEFVFIPPILLSPFLVDVLLTLNYRVRRREPFWRAHRDHVYQLGLKPPLSLKHWQVSIGHWMIAGNCAALAFAAAIIGFEAPLAVFLGVTLLGAWMHIRIRRAAIAAGMTDESPAETSADMSDVAPGATQDSVAMTEPAPTD